MLHGIGIDTSWRPDDTIIEQTLLQIRFPRVAMSLLVGATLAVAGAVMQAIFGNPLAEPGVVGVSAGAALGAAIAIVLRASASLGGWGVAVLAFAGGFARHRARLRDGAGRRPHRGRHPAADRHRRQRLRRRAVWRW